MKADDALLHGEALACALAEPPAVDGPSDRELLERFVRGKDGAAFEALVRRHGAMVLGVCRRVLDHAQDAEDAFQATFLVLVRKAGSIGRPELLGNWLYGVAFRTARKARAQAARRAQCEREAAVMAIPDPLLEVAWRDLRSVLDEELQRLPAKYRAPLVLCYLEGLTNEQAARRLGWPVGSMSYRLARGREALRERLGERDRAVPAGLLGVLLARNARPGEVPPHLVDSTVEAALGSGGGAAKGAGATAAAVLAHKTLRAMAAARRKAVAWLLLAAAVLALVAGAFGYAALTGRWDFGLGSPPETAPGSPGKAPGTGSGAVPLCH
jgi:RNA polymerase sigma factor (sigma-70 family)